MRRVVMSGIQPSGVFHLGNILGAVQMWRKLSAVEPASTLLVFMIADLHALTSFKPPARLRSLRHEALASLLACGLDPVRCNLYFQSQASAHSEMHWLLSSVSNMGSLGRMVQWKSKAGLDPRASLQNLRDRSDSDANNRIGEVSLALFSYPVLQAADVLVNDATIVPVGGDQAQHLELTRHLARVFNYKFGSIFQEPETLLTPCQRVLSLRNASKKMSKSDPDKSSCIYLSDPHSAVAAKLRAAVTDSIPGPILSTEPGRDAVNNLVSIAAGLLDTTPAEFLQTHRPQSHSALKMLVTDVVEAYLAPLRAEYERYLSDPAYIEAVATEGARVARERTNAALQRAKNAMGL